VFALQDAFANASHRSTTFQVANVGLVGRKFESVLHATDSAIKKKRTKQCDARNFSINNDDADTMDSASAMIPHLFYFASRFHQFNHTEHSSRTTIFDHDGLLQQN